MADGGLAPQCRRARCRSVRNPKSEIRNRPTQALFLSALLLALAGSPALAQGIDVTATLDITNGLARPGAYVPVRLKVADRPDWNIEELRVSSGGPVQVLTPWWLSRPLLFDATVPVYYAGGDLDLTIELRAGGGSKRTRVKVALPPVKTLEHDAALIAVDPELLDPDEAAQAGLRHVLGASTLHVLRLGDLPRAQVDQCGMLDAFITQGASRIPEIRSITVDPASPQAAEGQARFPLGVMNAVQPEAFLLFGAKTWPADERRRLWLWLGLFALAVPVVGVLAGGRRRVFSAIVMGILAAATTGAVRAYGEVRLARVQEAAVYWVSASATSPSAPAACEYFLFLQSRGGQPARHPPEPCRDGSGSRMIATLPIPLVATAEDLFQTQAVLRQDFFDAAPRPLSRMLPQWPVLGKARDLAERAESNAWPASLFPPDELETLRPLVLFHVLGRRKPPFDCRLSAFTPSALAKLADRSDLVAALLVEGDRGKDAAGKTQSLDAWAVEWQASKDPDVAFAGRSLAWWKKDRQEGEGPWILSWWHDPLPAGEASENHERLPALVVDSSASKQP